MGLPSTVPEICAILFDYGGVLAEEGFREGLMAIGSASGLGADEFFRVAGAAAYASGYVVGLATEQDFWNIVRQHTGIGWSDGDMRGEIFQRFELRSWMMGVVRALRGHGYRVCILSDQTQWLDELNQRDDFFKDFDRVFNSYHLHKGKNDPTVFPDVAGLMGVPPSSILFVDDNSGNVARAQACGIHTILYEDKDTFLRKIGELGLLP